jgi:Tfp pilus assembly protein PilX
MAKNSRSLSVSSSQVGQAGLIVVLMAVVVLTIGLSLFVRTTRQVDIASQQEESARIFNAAESGVEKALADVFKTEQTTNVFENVTNQDILVDNNNAKVSLQVAQENKLETYLDQGSSAEVKVTTADPITVLWSKVSCAQGPAALIIAIENTDPGTGAQTARFEAVKGQGCTSGTNFTESGVGTAPYLFSHTLVMKAGDKSVRIEPIFAGTDIAATGLSINKAQFVVTAKAQDNSGASSQAKAIEVKRTLATPPTFMNYTVYSGTSVVK